MAQESLSNDVIRARIESDRENDRASMDSAILGVVREFANLENDISAILEELLNGSWIFSAPLIYYALNSSETRMTIVSVVFNNVLWPDSFKQRVPALWKTFNRRLKNIREKRNKVVHGQVGQRPNRSGYGTQHRLYPAFGDIKNLVQSLNSDGGMSGHDVQEVVDNIVCLRADAADFRHILRSIRLDMLDSAIEPLQSLEDRHLKDKGRSNSQKRR